MLEELGFLWYEDPLAEDDIYNYTKLRQKLTIPLMATEYSPGGFHSYANWIVAQATASSAASETLCLIGYSLDRS